MENINKNDSWDKYLDSILDEDLNFDSCTAALQALEVGL